MTIGSTVQHQYALVFSHSGYFSHRHRYLQVPSSNSVFKLPLLVEELILSEPSLPTTRRLPTMNPESRNSKLKRLDLYLRGLPSSLAIVEPFSRYNFTHFSLDPDWVEAIGSVEGAVNRELEVRLGTRANGPIEFVERGPQVEALVGVLDHYLTQFPHDTLLAAWIDDSLAGAIHTYSKANTSVSTRFTKHFQLS
jgi:hypothetical protein